MGSGAVTRTRSRAEGRVVLTLFLEMAMDTMYAKVSLTPKWAHNCDRCVFIGGVTLREDEVEGEPYQFDVYICQGYETDQYVARYGDDGQEYASGAAIGLRMAASTASNRAISIACVHHTLRTMAKGRGKRKEAARKRLVG